LLKEVSPSPNWLRHWQCWETRISGWNDFLEQEWT